MDDLSDLSLGNLSDAPEVRFRRGRSPRRRRSVMPPPAAADLHQAARRSVPRSIEQPARTTDVNVRGTLNILLAARDQKARVVFASSSSVYGDQERFPLNEELPLKPRSPYAASKRAGEAYCRAWSHAYGVPTVALRYFNVYGPRQDPKNEYAAVVPRFVAACLTGSRPQIHGDGEQARDFTYIDDVVEANLLAARAGERAWGQAVNIGGGGKPTSVNRLLELIAELAEVRNLEIEHSPPRNGDVRRTEADVSLARKLIGYQPLIQIEEGIRRTVEWFQAQDTRIVGNTSSSGSVGLKEGAELRMTASPSRSSYTTPSGIFIEQSGGLSWLPDLKRPPVLHLFPSEQDCYEHAWERAHLPSVVLSPLR